MNQVDFILNYDGEFGLIQEYRLMSFQSKCEPKRLSEFVPIEYGTIARATLGLQICIAMDQR